MSFAFVGVLSVESLLKGSVINAIVDKRGFFFFLASRCKSTTVVRRNVHKLLLLLLVHVSLQTLRDQSLSLPPLRLHKGLYCPTHEQAMVSAQAVKPVKFAHKIVPCRKADLVALLVEPPLSQKQRKLGTDVGIADGLDCHVQLGLVERPAPVDVLQTASGATPYEHGNGDNGKEGGEYSRMRERMVFINTK